MHFLKNLTVSAALLLSSLALAAPTPTIPTTTLAPRQNIIEDIADLLEIAEDATNIVSSLISDIETEELDAEATWTQNMAALLEQNYPGRNYMIYHDQKSSAEFTNSVHVHYEFPLGLGFTKGYEIQTFDEGTFALHGDGGFANWAFGGSFDRDGDFVQFYAQD